MTREQRIVKTLQALKDVVVKTCVACEGSPLPECKDEMEMEMCLHHTFLSIIVDAFQDNHPKYDVITSIVSFIVNSTRKTTSLSGIVLRSKMWISIYILIDTEAVRVGTQSTQS